MRTTGEGMSLFARLWMLVGALLVASVVVGGYGIYATLAEEKLLESGNSDIQYIVQAKSLVDDIDGIFKNQVHSWKNILIRGGNGPEDFDKYLKRFNENNADVQKDFATLRELGTSGAQAHPGVVNVAGLDKIRGEHVVIYGKYQEALKLYDPNKPDESIHVVDKAVRGVDEPLTKAIEAFSTGMASTFQQEIARTNVEANKRAVNGRFVTAGIIAVALIISVLMARPIVTSITRLVAEIEVKSRESEAQRALAEEGNRRNQEAILRLLDEIGGLADGDLTQRATVTEDFTGAIADAMNYTIDALRDLVGTINATAFQVTEATGHTHSTTRRLSDASDMQAQQISVAGTAITEITSSARRVADNAQASTEVARRSVEIAKRGAVTVQGTIQGMESIREQIQETSKRVKRLGESSQEIGEIVELINDIAAQTNILALNASIQAAIAGEAGRGFVVVADEVQHLAERVANSTKQIEGLVKTIQTDTNEAVISMEKSTAGVVSGSQLAQEAGKALTEIEAVSADLASLIGNISEAAQQQSVAANDISETMRQIQSVTAQTSQGTTETAESVTKLADMAQLLKHSVSGFKLPAA